MGRPPVSVKQVTAEVTFQIGKDGGEEDVESIVLLSVSELSP